MKKGFFLPFMIVLASCSGIQQAEHIRGPASVCSDSMKNFLKEDSGKASFKETELVFLQEKAIADFLKKQKSEKEEVESALLLIKKKYRHMDPDQVIGHFKLLRNSCLSKV